MPTMKNRNHADKPVPTLSAALGHKSSGRARKATEPDTLMENFRGTGGKGGKKSGISVSAGSDSPREVTLPTKGQMAAKKRHVPKMPHKKG